MSRPKVFVTRKIPESGLGRICETCDTEVWQDPLPPSRDTLLSKIRGCDGVVTLLTEKVDRDFLDAAGSQLKVISNYAVGFNNVDIEEANRRRVRVGNTPGVLTEATADLAFALLIAAARHVVSGHQYVAQGSWKTWEPLGHIGQDLHGKTIGIVGMGRIGYAMAKKCHRGWDMQVLYHARHPNEAAERELGARQVDFETLLETSDFVSVHADLNPTTQGMFNAAAFAKMKPTAVFINTARGPLHVQADLYQALKSGEIFAAGLDVTDPEPMSKDDPLLTLPNAVVLPHIGSGTVSSRNAMADLCAENLLLGLQEKPLKAWVNPF